MSEGTIVLETKRRVSDIVEDIPFNKVHFIILIAGTLGFMFDAFDFFIVAYALPLVSRTWHVNAETIGLIGAASAAGMGIGNLFWGPICDRWGRKLGFILSVLGFSLLTGLSALAWSPQALMVFRFMTGLFLGGPLV